MFTDDCNFGKFSQIILGSKLEAENYGNYDNANSKPLFSLQVFNVVGISSRVSHLVTNFNTIETDEILCLIHASKRLVEFSVLLQLLVSFFFTFLVFYYFNKHTTLTFFYFLTTANTKTTVAKY